MKKTALFLLIVLFAASACGKKAPRSGHLSRGYSIPLIDLAAETERQVVVDREPGQYLGHPTTVLLEDGRTIIAVYPKGHGRGPIVMKRSSPARSQAIATTENTPPTAGCSSRFAT